MEKIEVRVPVQVFCLAAQDVPQLPVQTPPDPESTNTEAFAAWAAAELMVHRVLLDHSISLLWKCVKKE